LAALARRTRQPQPLVSTNYGIASGLRCLVPPSHVHAWFGKPTLYAGERGALELARVLCRSADAFVDIGAHLGFFTFYVRQRGSPTVPVHFFEPDPDLFRLLQTNVRANRLAQVEGHQVAIGSADGTARFYANQTDSFSGSLTEAFADRHVVTGIDVHLRSFSSIATELGLFHACVKVDVENAEFAFLSGASGSFDRISYLIMEVLGDAHAKGFVRELMMQSGFNAFYINDYSLEPSVDGSFRYRSPEYNWLFCRESPGDLARLLRGTWMSVHG
jgi:FkbM family methyltransferase